MVPCRPVTSARKPSAAARACARFSLVFRAFLAGLFALVASCAAPVTPTLEMSPGDRTLTAGEKVALTVTRQFPGGLIENVTAHVVYSSTNPSVARVAETGEVVAQSVAGTVTVKAADPMSGAAAAVTFTVLPARIVSIEVTPTPATVMPRGTVQPFRANAVFNDGTTRDVTREVSWSSTNLAAAVVGDTPSDKGVVTAVAAGDASILATDGATRVQGRTQVFVTGGPPELVSIVVTPNPGIVGVGKTAPWNALGVFRDGTSRDLTREVTWSSSRTDIATVDALGVVTGVAAGDTTITAVGTEPNTRIRGSAAAKVIP